jgi:hypothetical protein
MGLHRFEVLTNRRLVVLCLDRGGPRLRVDDVAGAHHTAGFEMVGGNVNKFIATEVTDGVGKS